jgi:hypothetical protein
VPIIGGAGQFPDFFRTPASLTVIRGESCSYRLTTHAGVREKCSKPSEEDRGRRSCEHTLTPRRALVDMRLSLSLSVLLFMFSSPYD